MGVEIPKQARADAVASIERYFQEQLEQRIGNIAAPGHERVDGG